jgi:hypothetical protein
MGFSIEGVEGFKQENNPDLIARILIIILSILIVGYGNSIKQAS